MAPLTPTETAEMFIFTRDGITARVIPEIKQVPKDFQNQTKTERSSCMCPWDNCGFTWYISLTEGLELSLYAKHFVEAVAEAESELEERFVPILRLHVHRTGVPRDVASFHSRREVGQLSFGWTLQYKPNRNSQFLQSASSGPHHHFPSQSSPNYQQN